MPPRRPSWKPRSSSRLSAGSRRSTSSSSSVSRKSQRSLSGSTAEPPVVEKSAADAARTVDAVVSEPAPRPAAVPTASSAAAAPLAQRWPSTRRLSMMTESTHRFAFDGTRPTREETKTSELKTQTDVKRTTGERLTTTSSRYQRSQVRRVKMALVAGLLIAVVIALVLLTLAWLYWSGYDTATSDPLPVCRTADCDAHAKVLSSSIASSIDPCKDFSLFVCTAWNHSHTPMATSFIEQLLIDSLLALTLSTTGSGGDVTLEDRPARFMELCKTARPKQDSQAVEALKEFLLREDINFIGWSRKHSVTYDHVLEALAVFTVKWFVPLWFRLDLIADGQNSSVIVIESEPLVMLWNKVQETRLSKSFYKYLGQFSKVLYNYDEESPLCSPAYMDFLWDMSPAVQTDVFRILNAAASTRLPIPVVGKLSDLPDFASNFTSAAWAAALSKVFGKSIGEHHAVYVNSRRLLDAMNDLSSSFSAEILLYHSYWWFVQQIGSLSSNDVFDITLGTITESGVGLLCGMQGIVAYNVLLASRHAATIPAAARQSIEDTLNMVHSVAKTTVRASKHLGQRAQNSTYSMLLESHPAVWPIPPNFDPVYFQSLYGGRADDGSRGFFGHWLTTREGFQRSSGSKAHRAAAKFYRLDPSSLTAYSPADKVVSVATAAFRSPFYYGAGTAAMRYGGLGFAYATQLVRNMDVRALLDAAAASKSHVADEKDHLLESFDCSDADEKQQAFPHLPALVLAHAAYDKSTNGTTRDPRLPGMEQYTGLQVFFMTACLSVCEQDASGRQWSSEFNAAARNYAPFAEAFGCSADTPMNPKEKCSLLKN